MRNAGLEAQAGIKIPWRNINNLRYADDTTLMAESEEELKSHPDLVPWSGTKLLKKQRHSFANKNPSSQSQVFYLIQCWTAFDASLDSSILSFFLSFVVLSLLLFIWDISHWLETYIWKYFN